MKMYRIILGDKSSWTKKLRIMKLTVILLLGSMVAMSATTYSQNTRLNVSSKNASLIDIFRNIEDQSEFYFYFNKEEVKSKEAVSVEMKDALINDILDQVLANTGLEYKIIDRYVVVKLKGSADPVVAMQVLHKVSGKVTDLSGVTLPGVSVVVKGTTNGTITDVGGNYSITNIPENSVLVFSFVGMKAQELKIGNQTTLNVKLSEESVGIEEVVAVGYGTQKKVNLTGSVSTIKGEQMAKRSVSQTSQAFQGLAPGLTVTQENGNPGSTATFNIRGVGTLGNSSPLILIDGVEGDINSINSNDIENISILKDAASASIYGSRAANGVILVTTRRAGVNKISIDVRTNVGVQSLTRTPKFVGGVDYINLRNETYLNEGKSPIYTQDYVTKYAQNHPSDAYPETDWVKAVFSEPGVQQSYGVTAMGGNEKARLLASINYINQNGNMPNTGFNRYGLRINSDITPSKKLSISLDINASMSDRWEPGMGFWEVFYQTYRTAPIYADYYENGTRLADGNQGINPVSEASAAGKNSYQGADLIANGKVIYEIVKGLKANFVFSPHLFYGTDKLFQKKVALQTLDKSATYYRPNMTTLKNQSNQNVNLNTKAYFTYDKKIKDHSFSALAGFEKITFKNNWFSGYRENFVLPEYSELNAGSVTNQLANGSGYEWGLESYFGRLNYDYKGKYLLEANVRYDGSSRFNKENRWGVFPSFSAGWRLSEENFMKSLKWVSNLKLIASWGVLGNQDIGNYPYLSTIALGQNNVYNHVAANGAAQMVYANSNISWETTKVTNLGVDFGLFKSRLKGSFEYYNKDTYDILLKLPIPATTGLQASEQNAGEVSNKGWELSLGYQDRVGELKYAVNFMLSDVKNKVVGLNDGGPFYSSGNLTITKTGSPINSLFGYVSEGLFQTQAEIANHATQFGTVAPGDIKYKDLNNDGIINEKDRAIIGNTIPRFTYSSSIQLEYKGFDLNVLMQGVGKRESFMINDAVWAFYNGGLAQTFALDRWTPQNTNASYPRLTANFPNNQKPSDYWMKSASYFRLKNIQVGYSLNPAILKKIDIAQARIYLSADNFFQIDKYWNGWDPEAPVGTDGAFYPQTKIVSVGLDVKF